ncbi:hypothetical protein CMI37_05300 [Candidatus Pacearchaeota archaeon]|nr:hypothetical protein [Candidatus Pacearchaeota archaeon]|tara:strand:+ start:1082 stop:3358 length:2277 start_codon:yes stop_codon:yes gene_type:complete
MVLSMGRRVETRNENIISPKQRMVIDNFSEGYIDKLDINMLPPNSFYYCQNVIMDSKGSVETRTGLDSIFATVPGNFRHRQIEFAKVNDTDYLISSYSNKIAYLDTATDTMVDVFTGLASSTVTPDFINYNNNLYAISDGDTMQVWDGSSTWTAGVTKPGTTCTAALSINAPSDRCVATEGSATGLTGNYSYKTTFVNATGESGASPASTGIDVSDKKIDLDNIPIGPTGTTARKIYRTKAYGVIFYLHSTIADNTTIVMADDDTADSALGAVPPDLHWLNGKYKYAVSFVWGTDGVRGESSLSSRSNEIDLYYGQMALTSIPTGAAGCTARKIYRTEGDDSDGDLRYVATIDDNVTTTYVDNDEDANLGSIGEEDTYVTLDFAFGLLKKKSATVWGVKTAEPTTVYICKSTYPEQCPADNFITLPDTGESIYALIEYFDDVYVFMPSKIYKITGETISTMAVSVVSQTAGCVARNTLKHARQDMIFLSYNGLYTLNRVLMSSNENTIDVTPLSAKVGDTFKAINWDYADKSCASVFNEQYVISFPKDSATQNNFTFLYNFENKNWTIQTGKFGQVASYTVGDVDADSQLELIIGSSAQDGQIYKWPNDDVWNDNGQPFDSHIILAPFAGGMPESRKRHKFFFIEAEASGDWDLYIWYRKELRAVITAGWLEKTISLNPNISGSATAIPSFYPVNSFYPVTAFGGVSGVETKLVISDGKGLSGQSKYIQFKIGNNGNSNEHFKLFKFIYYYRVKKPRP